MEHDELTKSFVEQHNHTDFVGIVLSLCGIGSFASVKIKLHFESLSQFRRMQALDCQSRLHRNSISSSHIYDLVTSIYQQVNVWICLKNLPNYEALDDLSLANVRGFLIFTYTNLSQILGYRFHMEHKLRHRFQGEKVNEIFIYLSKLSLTVQNFRNWLKQEDVQKQLIFYPLAYSHKWQNIIILDLPGHKNAKSEFN